MNINLQGQTVGWPLEGPYKDYEGSFSIKTAMHFLSSPGWPQTQSGLDDLALDILDALNQEFNQHGIYFYGEGNPNCEITANVVTIADFIDEPERMDINLQFISTFPDGSAFGLPSTGLRMTGDPEGDMDRWLTILIHEMGHCLGLFHIHTDTNLTCAENDPNAGCNNSPNICDCCGDHVCDTPTHHPDDITENTIKVNSTCTASIDPLGVVPEIFTNYMSYVDDLSYTCRNHFTLGQGKRMRAMLAESDILQEVLNESIDVNGPLSGGVHGNIIIKSGKSVDIDDPIEMLPGTHIYVEKGAKLTIRSTITGACGEMWQGIIVDGSSNQTQTTANQGYVLVLGNGKIEHARVGIDVQGNGPAAGGGIVKSLWGTFENNEIGIRFGQYSASVNACFLYSPDFLINDDYKGNKIPILFQAEGIRQPRILSSKFKDMRTVCTDPLDQAIGIELYNASLFLTNAEFENLSTGIWADEIDASNGSFSVSYSDFTSCLRSIHVNMTNSFVITNNDFAIRKPSPCPSTGYKAVGVWLSGPSSDFTIKKNDFFGDQVFSDEQIIGIYTSNTGEGMAKVIRENSFSGMYEGALAELKNGGNTDGVLYLCNSFADGVLSFTLDLPYAIHVPLTGSVRTDQGVEVGAGLFAPTGNVFTGAAITIFNNDNNTTLNYHFSDDNDDEDPGPAANNIDAISHNESAGCPTPSTPEPPCPHPPCPTPFVSDWQNDFYDIKSLWQAKLANLPNITDQTQLDAEQDTIRHLRREMNKLSSNLLQQYSRDTNQVEVDSIVAWLDRTDTYSADMRLARHHFFTSDFSRFDVLWQQIPLMHVLDADEISDYNELDLLYDVVRPHLQTTGTVKDMDQATLDSLGFWSNWCAEPGYLSRSLLRRNGIIVEVDCSKNGVESRSNDAEIDENWYNAAPLGIYPNPANHSVTVSVDGQSNTPDRVAIYDLQGHLVLGKNFLREEREITLDLNGIPNGFYLIKTSAVGCTFQVGKLLINH